MMEARFKLLHSVFWIENELNNWAKVNFCIININKIKIIAKVIIFIKNDIRKFEFFENLI